MLWPRLLAHRSLSAGTNAVSGMSPLPSARARHLCPVQLPWSATLARAFPMSLPQVWQEWSGELYL